MIVLRAVPPPSGGSSPVRVLVADDHERSRSGLVRGLRRDSRLEVVDEVDSGPAAVAAIVAYRPDVAVLDMRLPVLDALEVWRHVREVDSDLAAAVMVLTATPDAPRAVEIAEAIARPVVGKDHGRREIADRVVAYAVSRATSS